jgi:lamin tail-like protein
MVTGLKDCAGNAVGERNYADFGMPQDFDAGDIVINEILFNPRTGGADFVELVNRTAGVIDLKKLYVANANDDNTVNDFFPVAPSGFLLLPGAYCVITEDPAALAGQYYVPYPQQVIRCDMPSFNDDAGVCMLIDLQGKRYDQLNYDDDMHFALLDDKDGVSLERIDFNRSTQDRTNWTSTAGTAGYATPGYRNSQYAGVKQATSALSIEPEIFSPDGDGYNDVVNFSYRFSEPGYTGTLSVYDAKGVLVKQVLRSGILGTSGTFSWDGATEKNDKAAIGIYVAYFEVFNLKGDVKTYKSTLVLGGRL